MNEFERYRNTIGDRVEMYKAVAEAFDIQSVLYPGSHIDIMPSFVIPKAYYVDSFKGAIAFFKDMEMVQDIIDKNKQYKEQTEVVFLGQDYTTELDIDPVEMIISLYAGFVGQATEKYLKKNGIFLCNDSHGDATLTYVDSSFELIGVVTNNYKLIFDGLNTYFKFKRPRDIDLKKVKQTMKGPKYAIMPFAYIFKKVQ